MDTEFTSYSSVNKNTSPSTKLRKEERESLGKLKSENNFVIQKPDKGNIIIVYKDSYLRPVETFLEDSLKFKNILVASDKDFIYAISLKKELSIFCKAVKMKNQSVKKHIIN